MSTSRAKIEQETRYRREGEAAPKNTKQRSRWVMVGTVVAVVVFLIVAIFLLAKMFKNPNLKSEKIKKN